MLFCPLCSGSSGNATFIEAGGRRILVDAGATGKRLTALLAAVEVPVESIDAVFVTHEHSDHIQGVGVLARRCGVQVFANAETYAAMEHAVGRIPPGQLRIVEPDRPFFFGGASVLPFSIPHDSARAMGYTFTADGHKCAVMTDIGCVQDAMLDAVAGAEVLLIEANHDVDMLLAGSYPFELKRRILSARGHLSNDDCGRALVLLYERGVKNVVLGHLSEENNTEALALVTVRAALAAAGLSDKMQVHVAARYCPERLFELP